MLHAPKLHQRGPPLDLSTNWQSSCNMMCSFCQGIHDSHRKAHTIANRKFCNRLDGCCPEGLPQVKWQLCRDIHIGQL